jgi:hypothetical protein
MIDVFSYIGGILKIFSTIGYLFGYWNKTRLEIKIKRKIRENFQEYFI